MCACACTFDRTKLSDRMLALHALPETHMMLALPETHMMLALHALLLMLLVVSGRWLHVGRLRIAWLTRHAGVETAGGVYVGRLCLHSMALNAVDFVHSMAVLSLIA